MTTRQRDRLGVWLVTGFFLGGGLLVWASSAATAIVVVRAIWRRF